MAAFMNELSPSDISEEEFTGFKSFIETDANVSDFNLYNEEFLQQLRMFCHFY
jgi:hypothetical protein